MFLEYTDYRVVAGEAAFNAVSQGDVTLVENAEREAIEEICGYLRPKYDVEAIFSCCGSDRNAQIVMLCADISLYHLVSSQPGRLGYEIRDVRYRRAIKWLEDVSSGKIVPDLPLSGGDVAGGGSGPVVSWGSQWKRGNEW